MEKTEARLAQPGNESDADQPVRTAVPTLNVELTIPLKYLSNFWRSLDLPLTNCEVEPYLSWTKSCVLVEHNNKKADNDLKIKSTKIHVPVVTLSISDNIKFLENLNQGVKKEFLGINIDLS